MMTTLTLIMMEIMLMTIMIIITMESMLKDAIIDNPKNVQHQITELKMMMMIVNLMKMMTNLSMTMIM